jgi:hypothetical protein
MSYILNNIYKTIYKTFLYRAYDIKKYQQIIKNIDKYISIYFNIIVFYTYYNLNLTNLKTTNTNNN